jgi:HAE1 family hydrophobic/amphiphilic exporter-1
VVGWQDGSPVYVRDIAQVEFGWADRTVAVRQLGNPSIAFGILRKTGANTVEVMKRVRVVVDYLNSQYAAKGIELEVAYDETEYIDEAVGLVSSNLLYGAALAVIVLLLFLRSGISTFIVAFTIPISVVVTFIFLQAFGRSLNIISLAGLAFAVGMVVDNAIVVLENIFRHQQMGKPPMRAAFDGTTEVWGAILSSTLTTLAVFVPILFVEQEAGQLFKDIAIALSCSIGMSLFVSITVIPMLCSRLLKVKAKRPGESVARAGTVVARGIVGAVAWLTAGPIRKTSAAIGIIAWALILAWTFLPPMDYLPQGNRPMIFGLLLTPPGFNVTEMEEIVETVENRILELPELEHMFAVALPDDPIIGAIIKDEHSDKKTMQRLIKQIQGMGFGVPGVNYPVFFQVPLFAQRGGFLAGDLEVTVKGPDLGVIQGLAGRIEGMSWGIAKDSGFSSVQSSFESGLPEIQVRADREKAAPWWTAPSRGSSGRGAARSTSSSWATRPRGPGHSTSCASPW